MPRRKYPLADLPCLKDDEFPSQNWCVCSFITVYFLFTASQIEKVMLLCLTITNLPIDLMRCFTLLFIIITEFPYMQKWRQSLFFRCSSSLRQRKFLNTQLKHIFVAYCPSPVSTHRLIANRHKSGIRMRLYVGSLIESDSVDLHCSYTPSNI